MMGNLLILHMVLFASTSGIFHLTFALEISIPTLCSTLHEALPRRPVKIS